MNILGSEIYDNQIQHGDTRINKLLWICGQLNSLTLNY